VRPTDALFLDALRRRDSIVLVKGARQMGKTSMLARALHQARDRGARVVLTDFQALNASELQSADTLIRALALLEQRRPEWRGALSALIVGGEGENARARWNAEQRRLHTLRTELGVADAVHFLGARPQEQLPTLYAAADIVTMPSHYESFGLATLEGLACGRPVVATATGGPALIVENGLSGLLAAPGDHLALAGQLEHLLADDALRAQMGDQARQRAERFGWPAVTCDIQQIYRDTLERATLRPTVTLRQCVRAS